jgi:hypothetical protein
VNFHVSDFSNAPIDAVNISLDLKPYGLPSHSDLWSIKSMVYKYIHTYIHTPKYIHAMEEGVSDRHYMHIKKRKYFLALNAYRQCPLFLPSKVV